MSDIGKVHLQDGTLTRCGRQIGLATNIVGWDALAKSEAQSQARSERCYSCITLHQMDEREKTERAAAEAAGYERAIAEKKLELRLKINAVLNRTTVESLVTKDQVTQLADELYEELTK